MIENFDIDLKLAIDDVSFVIKKLWNDVNLMKIDLEKIKEKIDIKN